MTLQEIAAGINAHLKRFERDPKTNPVDPKYKTTPFYATSATVPLRRRKVSVIYVAYQGADREAAEQARYLSIPAR